MANSNFDGKNKTSTFLEKTWLAEVSSFIIYHCKIKSLFFNNYTFQCS